MLAIDARIDSQLLTKRGHKQVMRKLLRQAMTRIRQNLPRHFERNADTTPNGGYHYEKRTAKYMKKKARFKGHQKPLVYTGRLRSAILGNVRITATASRARLKTRGYFPMKTERRREIETISREERRQILARMGRDYVRLAKRSEYQRKRSRK